MATYTVQCDNCNSNHERNAFAITNVVKNCKWCGDDLCPDCERVGDYHADCDEQRIEDEKEDNG